MNARLVPSEFLPLTAADRQRIEAAMEALIAFLDEADGDPELEPVGDDEPNLGGYSWRGQYDLEADQGDEEPDVDASAADGRSIRMHRRRARNGTAWACGSAQLSFDPAQCIGG